MRNDRALVESVTMLNMLNDLKERADGGATQPQNEVATGVCVDTPIMSAQQRADNTSSFNENICLEEIVWQVRQMVMIEGALVTIGLRDQNYLRSLLERLDTIAGVQWETLQRE